MPDALVLCGGAGVRLRETIGNVPKPMAQIGSRPFLDILLRQLRRNGFRRVILAVGHRQDVIRNYVGETFEGMQIVYSSEASPLGTGGAVRNCLDHVRSGIVLVMNGDSYIDADLGSFVSFHCDQQCDASLLVTPMDERTDCGAIHLTNDATLSDFAEKQGSGAPYLNAGIYVFSSQVISDIPAQRQVSLETDVIPQWLAAGKSMKGFVWQGPCIDIGTPERYRSAQISLGTAEMEQALKQYTN